MEQLHPYVDPDHPEMWRTEPFYSDLKDSAHEAAKRRCRLTVYGQGAIITAYCGPSSVSV